jgi:hypothetical protein
MLYFVQFGEFRCLTVSHLIGETLFAFSLHNFNAPSANHTETARRDFDTGVEQADAHEERRSRPLASRLHRMRPRPADAPFFRSFTVSAGSPGRAREMSAAHGIAAGGPR